MKNLLIIILQVFLPLLVFSQDLVSIIPSSADAGETLDVTITGSNTHFTQGSGTQVFFEFDQVSPSVINYIDIVSNTVIDANITLYSNIVTGNYDVSTYNMTDGLLTLYNEFYVNGVDPPYLNSILPSSADAGETLDVTITGSNTHFNQGSGTQVFFEFDQGSPTSINSLDIVSNTVIDANITVPSNTITGDYDVSTYNMTDGLLTLYNEFYVNGVDLPYLNAIVPSSSDAGQTLDVTITGTNTHFAQGSGTVVFFYFDQGSSTVINNIDIINNNTIDVNITIPSFITTGDYDVQTYNFTDGTLSLYNAFHVNEVDPAELVSVDPAYAVAGQTLDVAITGLNTHFNQGNGPIYVSFILSQGSGPTFYADNVVVENDNLIVADVSIPINASIGDYHLHTYYYIDGGLYLNNAFYVGEVDIKEIKLKSEILIYPNPTSGLVNIQSEKEIEKVEVFFIDGKRLICTRNKRIDLSKLSKGSYIFKITGTDGVFNKIVVKK